MFIFLPNLSDNVPKIIPKKMSAIHLNPTIKPATATPQRATANATASRSAPQPAPERTTASATAPQPAPQRAIANATARHSQRHSAPQPAVAWRGVALRSHAVTVRLCYPYAPSGLWMERGGH